MIFLLILAQAILNRWRGSSSSFPQTSRRLLCLLVPTTCMAIAGVDVMYQYLTIPFAYFGICAPHGRYFTLGRGPYPDRADDWPSVPAKKLGIRRDNWLFDALSLAVTGIAFTLPYSLAVSQCNLTASVIIFVSGIAKVLGYEIALRTTRGDHIRNAELLTGVIYGIGFTSVIWS